MDKLVDQYCVGVSIDYNVESFECAVEELLNSPTRLSEIAQQGRRVFSSEFGWSAMEGRLFAIYDHLLERGETSLTSMGDVNVRR